MAQSGFKYRFHVLKTLLSRPPRPQAGFWTVATTLALFAGSGLYWSQWRGSGSWMPASRRAVFENGEAWRLFTTLFAHADLGHLLANSLMYVILGYLLNGYFGNAVYPWLAWSLAIPMTALALLTYPPGTELIGASGLVHLMGGLWLILYFQLSRDLRLTQRILRAMGVMLALFFPTSFEPNVSYRVHFIGLGVGLLSGALYFALNQRRLRAFEETELEYEPDPAGVAEMERRREGEAPDASGWRGFEDWDDVHELDGVEGLTEISDDWDEDDRDDGDEDDDDPPGHKKPRRLGPGRGHA